MRTYHNLLDSYLTFGIPEDSHDDAQILEELKMAAKTLSTCIESLRISQTYAKVSTQEEQVF